MIKTFMNQSGKVNELRKTFDLCGKMYSGKFYDSLHEKDDKNVKAWSYKNNQVLALFRQEYIKVMKSEFGDLSWEAVEQKPTHKHEFDFQSSLGLFRSEDRGEFGGILITPKSTLHGNFGNLFEFNNRVYAIDSLNHMGIGHTRIYEFDKSLNANMLFETELSQLLALSSLEIEENRILILISGAILGDKGTFSDSYPCSYLFEISDEGFKRIAIFDFAFHDVYNMLLIDKDLIVGMDKVVAFGNIETKEISFYTPLTVEAENDIRKANNG